MGTFAHSHLPIRNGGKRVDSRKHQSDSSSKDNDNPDLVSRGVLVLSCPVSVDFPCCVPQSASQIGSPGHLKVLTLTLALHFLRHLGNICTKGDPEEEVLQERIGGPGIRLERHESDKAERSASPLCPPARQPVQGRAFKGKVLAILRDSSASTGLLLSSCEPGVWASLLETTAQRRLGSQLGEFSASCATPLERTLEAGPGTSPPTSWPLRGGKTSPGTQSGILGVDVTTALGSGQVAGDPALRWTPQSSESHTQDQTGHAHVSIQAETGGGTQGPTHHCRTSRRTGTGVPRPGFQLCWAAPALGTGADGEPKERSLAQLERGAQFPGTWRGQGQDHTAVCALLISGAPSAFAHWCPYLPHPREPPRAWPTANSRPPSSPDPPFGAGARQLRDGDGGAEGAIAWRGQREGAAAPNREVTQLTQVRGASTRSRMRPLTLAGPPAVSRVPKKFSTDMETAEEDTVNSSPACIRRQA
uniref:Uncharacterized protein n=1 Tax=Rangifer tarandus platyrhynchus TaxID=3082113 RepID=A0ACB0E874_RANTA|nr:unnamed protein product [Rangifer tarandus platyrhynchus]